MCRITLLLLGILLAACRPADRPSAISTPGSGTTACGTGSGHNPRVVERGLGGTGISAGDRSIADRGIGGTGIVGVITGFGSICVNNIEVDYDRTTPVSQDGVPVATHSLRQGQLVVVEATGERSPRARKISVLHQVSGPVELVASTRALRVAGQAVVLLSDAVVGDVPPKVGDWVRISGLRAPTGEISATRVDQRDPGRVFVRGVLTERDGLSRIGTLPVRLPIANRSALGRFVVAEGNYVDRVLEVEKVSRDLLASNPVALFDASVIRFSIETFALSAGSQIRNGAGWVPPLSPGMRPAISADRPVIIELEKANDGRLSASRVLAAPAPFGQPVGGIPRGVSRPPVPGSSMPPAAPGAPSGSDTGSPPLVPGKPQRPFGLPQPGSGGPGPGR